SMPLAIALACCLLRLTVAESIAAATVNAAYSLELHDRVGRLEPGMAADLVVLDRPSHLFLGYELGASAVRAVVKNGRIVRDRA
ncbi:MAG: amidohydrolase family protein, partial [Gemmatimonadetes bacterium]|nr:amidohydrolase family protein [Gemmatimonadota bacterium]